MVFAYDLAGGVVAVVLLIAATLKQQVLLRTGMPVAAGGVRQWAVIAMEWTLAAWLLSGLAPTWARRAMMLLLAVYVAVTGQKLLAGAADCGCFGTLQVRPGWTFSFDAAALAAIYLFGRGAFDGFGSSRRPHRLDRAAGALTLCLAVPGALLALSRINHGAGGSEAVVLLDPKSWVGKPFPLLEFVDAPARADLSSGRLVVRAGVCGAICDVFSVRLQQGCVREFGRDGVLFSIGLLVP